MTEMATGQRVAFTDVLAAGLKLAPILAAWFLAVGVIAMLITSPDSHSRSVVIGFAVGAAYAGMAVHLRHRFVPQA